MPCSQKQGRTLLPLMDPVLFASGFPSYKCRGSPFALAQGEQCIICSGHAPLDREEMRDY